MPFRSTSGPHTLALRRWYRRHLPALHVGCTRRTAVVVVGLSEGTRMTFGTNVIGPASYYADDPPSVSTVSISYVIYRAWSLFLMSPMSSVHHSFIRPSRSLLISSTNITTHWSSTYTYSISSTHLVYNQTDYVP